MESSINVDRVCCKTFPLPDITGSNIKICLSLQRIKIQLDACFRDDRDTQMGGRDQL